MEKIVSILRQSKLLNAVFFSHILLSFHYYLVIYVNSSFLDKFFSENQISTLYIIGSVINILLLLNISKILNKIGNYKTAIFAVIIEAISILGLVLSTNHFLIGFYFVLTQIMTPLILFNLDVFLESVSTKEEDTGNIRGIYLTAANITLVVSPTIVSFLVVDDIYLRVYLLSFVFLIPLYFFIRKFFRNYKDSTQAHILIKETLGEYLTNKKIFNIFIVYFLLQFFYAYMIVYMPLYLHKYIGFEWSEIGVMFTIMLLPFVLFEIPVGNLADNKYGEKEFLTIGLLIIGLSTIVMSFISIKMFFVWAGILFISRVGASIVEITSDSYFFKQVNQDKTNIISFYRIARPLSFIVAPVVATLSFQFLPIQYVFIIIGAVMIIGTKYSLSIEDTR